MHESYGDIFQIKTFRPRGKGSNSFRIVLFCSTEKTVGYFGLIRVERCVIRQYLDEVKRMVDALEGQADPLVNRLFQAYVDEKTVFLIGNGGSASNASHLGQDLSKATCMGNNGGKKFRALSLTDNTSYITALANDDGYETVFATQLANFAQPDDVLVAISGSGNSPNILRAVEYANGRQLHTIGITGFAGGKLAGMVHTHVNVPSNDIGLAEAVHSVLFHLLVAQLRERIARIP